MTAVEFLVEMFDLKTDFAIINQAKEIEKEQIIEACGTKLAEQYYDNNRAT